MNLLLATDDGVWQLPRKGEAEPIGLQGKSVRQVMTHPRNPRWVLAASDDIGGGIFLQQEGGGFKQILEGVAHRLCWDPPGRRLFAGLRGVHLCVSEDEGRTWEEVPAAYEAMRKPGVPEPHIKGHPLDILSLILPQVEIIYVGVEAGGLLYSNDHGRAFEPRSFGLHPDIHALTVDPHASARLYAATGHGFYVSENSGKSWTRTDPLEDRHYFTAVAVIPNAPHIVLSAVAMGAPPKWRTQPGGARAMLLRSTNYGQSWQRVHAGLPPELRNEISSLVPGENRGILYATTWDGEVYASHDSGSSWEEVSDDLPLIYSCLPLPE